LRGGSGFRTNGINLALTFSQNSSRSRRAATVARRLRSSDAERAVQAALARIVRRLWACLSPTRAAGPFRLVARCAASRYQFSSRLSVVGHNLRKAPRLEALSRTGPPREPCRPERSKGRSGNDEGRINGHTPPWPTIRQRLGCTKSSCFVRPKGPLLRPDLLSPMTAAAGRDKDRRRQPARSVLAAACRCRHTRSRRVPCLIN